MLSIELPSMAALASSLAIAGRSTCLGENVEAPSRFFVLDADFAGQTLKVGVVSDGSGSVAGEIVGDRVFVGHDRQVTIVSSLAPTDISTSRIEGAFFEFMELAAGQLVAIHELGLVGFSPVGTLMWRYHSTDIVEAWHRVGNRLRLDTMDGLSASVDLITGRPDRGE